MMYCTARSLGSRRYSYCSSFPLPAPLLPSSDKASLPAFCTRSFPSHRQLFDHWFNVYSIYQRVSWCWIRIMFVLGLTRNGTTAERPNYFLVRIIIINLAWRIKLHFQNPNGFWGVAAAKFALFPVGCGANFFASLFRPNLTGGGGPVGCGTRGVGAVMNPCWD